jgi:uncharacterized protein (TIGR03437 family)
MADKSWIFSLFFLLTSVAGSMGAPNDRSAPARMPVAFEAGPDGQLIARQGSHEVTLTAGRITATIVDAAAGRRASVTSELVGANPHVRPEGAEPLAARANYIVGNNPAQWRAGVPLFGRAVYRGLYPGIDLVFHGTDGDMEYDFVVQPGASVRPIAFQISGASALRLGPDGALEIATSAGEIRWHKPQVYQTADGVRREIAGRFVRHGRRVSFALGPYDHSRGLVIDPTLSYASYFGGSNNDAVRGMAVDASGNIYITGFTLSNNLPVTSGAFQTAYHGGTAGADFGGDVFAAKFTAAGALAYVTYIGGSVDDIGSAIAVDSSGNAYITGNTDSPDFPTVAGSFQTAYQGAGGNPYFGKTGDAFVLKLNAAGSALIYSTYLGGALDDRGTAIAIDSAGNAYVGGVTLSTNFPVLNAYQAAYKGGGGSPPFCCGSSAPFMSTGDGFLTKLNPGGTALLFSTYFGGSMDDSVTSLAIDSSGNVYMGGSTVSSDFPVLNAYQGTFGGAANADVQPVITTGDGWVAKFNSAGQPVFSTYLGGSSDDAVMGLAIDSTGAVYVTGFTSSANFPVTASAAQTKFAGPSTLTGERGFLWGDAFAAKLSPAGNSLVYSTFIGGSDDDAGMAIAVDSAGNAYVGGFSASTNFPITSKTALQSTFGGETAGATDPTGDGFLSQISPDGSAIVFSTYYGGSGDDAVSSVALDAQGNVYLAGATVSSNLAVTSNAVQPAFGGDAQFSETLGDGFLARIAGITTVSPTGPAITAVVNGASFLPGIVPNSWITVYGTNLSSVTDFWTIVNGQFPTQVDGVSVSVNGQPGYVEFISSGQINLVAPNVGAGPMQVAVTNSAGTSLSVSSTSATFGPAFFLWAYKYAVATYQNYTYAVQNGVIGGVTTVAAKPGDILILWGTGFGPTTPAAPPGEEVPATATYLTTDTVTVTIGNIPATVYGAALAPGFAGLYQVAIQVPATAPSGDQPIVASVGGVSSPSTTLITIQ